MEEIGKILPALFKVQVRRANPRLVEILAPLWPRVAGKPIAQHSRPIAFGFGTLTLATPCPSWAAQLRQMAEELRAEINSFLGGPVVKQLRVQYVLNPDWSQHPELRQRSAPPLEAAEIHEGEGTIKLDAETARVLERSFAKYFARTGRKAH